MGAGHKDRPKLLIEFDAIFDRKIGFLRYCIEHYPRLLNPFFITYNESLKKAEEIRKLRYEDKDFLDNIFADSKKDMGKKIYEETIQSDEFAFYDMSPLVPSMSKLISFFASDTAKSAGADDLCHLLARNEKEFAVLKTKFPRTFIVDQSGKEIFETDNYARIIISEPGHVRRYKTSFTLMAVIAFPENYEVIDGKKAITDVKAMIDTHCTNQFELIDPITY